MLSSAQLSQLEHAVACSAQCEQTTKVPALLTVAQWALESRWGVHQPGNNCFGIKAYGGCFGVQLLSTFEVVNGVRTAVNREFAVFPSLAACFEKHASLLTSGKVYASAWAHYLETQALETLIRNVAAIYATDPNYAAILLKIIAMPEVKAALARIRPQND